MPAEKKLHLHNAIGIFDSGVGGLSVLKAIRAALPQEDLVYVADSAHAPYGERSEDFIPFLRWPSTTRTRRITPRKVE